MSQEIHTGVWIDWSHGRVLGATITMSARDGALLLAFIATFVTVVATRLWRIVTFACHQILASGGEHDGLYYQRQLILRNTPTPMAATGLFLRQAWNWRGHANYPLLRTLPWAIGGVLYVAVFAVAAIFSSRISDGATQFRLLAAGDCGAFEPADRDALQQKSTYDNSMASVYARQCYTNSSAASCNSLPVSSIRWTGTSVECPFADDICAGSTGASAFKMESEVINSQSHLGINGADKYRVDYRRETVCAPLITGSRFARDVNGSEAETLGWEDNVLTKYLYGNLESRNYTHIYNKYGQNMHIGYGTGVYVSFAHRTDNYWKPIDALALDHRDITLMFIAPNSVLHLHQNDDPVFGANIPVVTEDGTTYYQPDRYVSPIACADRHEICNPNNGICTSLVGSGEIMSSAREERLELDPVQLATSFLEAQELVAELTQLKLPSDQWKREMGRLFADALSKLQHQVTEYATGPSIAVPGSIFKAWSASANSSEADEQVQDAHEAMCKSQITRDAQGTLNFSILGLSLLLAVGFVIIGLSFVLEPTTIFLQKKSGYGATKAKRWERDENLQVMRMLFELRYAGRWKGRTDSFPTTISKDRFRYDADYLGEEQMYQEIRHKAGGVKS
ncbi:hypothetical protein GCG54_00012859 [Colletotrichum gloeosporioides]|uniref:Uncharacterized protein n=1 Tax=Colletotrichum gloeosporioides TaxID=474922 RepID=A0A8H4CT36_COLGL|nr:uncharacterized protein GCG54_00012859 [Colletotrichum gloeosporioides]KAF3809573.1 hypothetical protein GCG54_00012859 [Colletotrichum gloeosporioides]